MIYYDVFIIYFRLDNYQSDQLEASSVLGSMDNLLVEDNEVVDDIDTCEDVVASSDEGTCKEDNMEEEDSILDSEDDDTCLGQFSWHSDFKIQFYLYYASIFLCYFHNFSQNISNSHETESHDMIWRFLTIFASFIFVQKSFLLLFENFWNLGFRARIDSQEADKDDMGDVWEEGDIVVDRTFEDVAGQLFKID